MNVIETENLSKTFRVKQKEKGIAGSMRAIFHPQIKEIPAVSRVSFSVEEGEALAFIGPNGAGNRNSVSRWRQSGSAGHGSFQKKKTACLQNRHCIRPEGTALDSPDTL